MPNYLQELSENPDDTIIITGSYTRTSNEATGLQTLALETNDAGVPTGICNNICGKDDGRYIMLPFLDSAERQFFVKDCISEIRGKKNSPPATITGCT